MPERLNVAPYSPQWQQERASRITGTDMPVILGISRYQSPYGLWHAKKGLMNVQVTGAMKLGLELEPYTASLWLEKHGGPCDPGGLYVSNERPWQCATVDYLHGPEPVECKTVASMSGWGEDGSDDVPPAVRAQLLWQMDVTGSFSGHVACLSRATGEFRSYFIGHQLVSRQENGSPAAECSVCEDQEKMRYYGECFLNQLKADQPPDVDGSAATLRALRELNPGNHGSPLHADPSVWRSYITWSQVIKEAEQKMAEAEARMRKDAGSFSHIVVDGKIVANRICYEAKVKPKENIRKVDMIRVIKRDEKDDDPQPS